MIIPMQYCESISYNCHVYVVYITNKLVEACAGNYQRYSCCANILKNVRNRDKITDITSPK